MPPERTGKIEAGSKPLFYPYRNAKFVLRDHFILIRMYIIKKPKINGKDAEIKKPLIQF